MLESIIAVATSLTRCSLAVDAEIPGERGELAGGERMTAHPMIETPASRAASACAEAKVRDSKALGGVDATANQSKGCPHATPSLATPSLATPSHSRRAAVELCRGAQSAVQHGDAGGRSRLRGQH